MYLAGLIQARGCLSKPLLILGSSSALMPALHIQALSKSRFLKILVASERGKQATARYIAAVFGELGRVAPAKRSSKEANQETY